MPRDLPIGNGKILINFDKEYHMRDVYYPHVGQENHTIGHVSRFGVWADGQFSWVGAGWDIRRNYLKETLVTDVLLHNTELGLDIRVHDVVDYHMDLLVREVHVTNLKDTPRKVRLFFHHDFHISENEVGDTAYFDPRTTSVIHYKKHRWFLTKTQGSNHYGVSMWSIGNKEVNGCEGTWKDAEDGELGRNAIAQGSVDSTVACELDIPPRAEETGYLWMAFGTNYEEVATIDRFVEEKKPAYFVPHNQNYWRLWVNPEHVDFLGLSPKIVDLFKRSLLVVRTQIDNDGAIIAANDHDIAQFARDTYSYMWPRDGALVAYSLTRAGYRDIAQRFFSFCTDVITDEGYLLHKYNPDKSLASSWHPWIRDFKEELPIQEDETALVLWCFWHNFRKFRNIEFMRPMLQKLLFNAADFLVRYRDEETKLPLPSWDLWEERYGVHLFTVCSVIGGLHGAANFAYALGELEKHRIYKEAAEEVTQAMIKHLWSEKDQRFCRMATRTKDGYKLDMTVDAAMYAIYAFAELSPHDAKVKSTMQAIRDKLWIKTDVGGVARYENDYYHQVSQDIANVPGNPWFICTMWLAGYDIAAARSHEDLREAARILEWVAEHALPSGVLAEQVHPYTNEPLSVSPLTWSHATFITVVMDYLEKQRVLMSENVFAHTITPV
ncbi:MAG TPA: glycoside hydrolase family 15 protein [Trichormus sp.]|jgi:GH15 family glucan-1,4-alpha-glucosidase